MRALFFCLLAFAASLAGAVPLPADVARELKAADIPLSAVGVVVQEVGKKPALVSLNAEQAMNPASVMKLVTTYAALDLLGPAHTWITQTYATGNIADGVLSGDLYLKGSGDPKLTQEQFWLLLRQLRARGVREIRGDLVLDHSAFAPVAQDTAFDNKPERPYNVAPDALLLNFKALRLTIIPQEGKHVALLAEPTLADVDIVNLIETTGGSCGEWKDGLRVDELVHDARYRLALTGSYPASCGEQAWNLGVLPHRDYTGAVFRDLWREVGGRLDGTVRDGVVPPGATPLAAIESPALSELVRDINKYSNNVMARQLFLSLATDSPATARSAANEVQKWLTAKGLSFPELVLENGAGLSRQERISAQSLAQLLQSIAASPLMPEMVASLPLAAVDGTMKKRLKTDAVAGHAHIKTGTLDGVKTMAGLVQNVRGRDVIVVFLVNHANAQHAQAAQDALLRWAYEH